MFDKVQKGRLLTNLEKERGAAQSASSAVQRLYHVQLDLRRIFLTHDSCCHFRSGDTKVSPTCSTLLYPEIEVQRGTGKCGKNALTFFNTAFICIHLHSNHSKVLDPVNTCQAVHDVAILQTGRGK